MFAIKSESESERVVRKYTNDTEITFIHYIQQKCVLKIPLIYVLFLERLHVTNLFL